MFFCLCLCRSICRRLDCISLFCLFVCPYAYAASMNQAYSLAPACVGEFLAPPLNVRLSILPVHAQLFIFRFEKRERLHEWADGWSNRRINIELIFLSTSFQPSSDDRSTITSTTSTMSYSSKFVPSIPDSFYKDLQSRLEDLIFKFECLDNEYAALQKISHRVHDETLEIKTKLSS